ncbi:Uncharacterized protein TCAP_03786 [Tolypocladium capitatum]|uniref:Fungal N-terminal domain-containing protein n=1 Tax=Tolypocladium capitatum TaxID=45235 RepID=A0A2K3QFG8_9HYPO|nr:Uncharacterized protein TCAP_03786 [Tolypocladium capitatum]
MSFSISFGDVYLMGKLALKIGQAFTKGKKSAPAEFREVESQLYSLSAALNAFSSARESSTIAPPIVDKSKLPKNIPSHFAENQDIILGMLRSCKETLSHLQTIVDKYSVISTSTDASQPRLKRWTKELKSDWRKISWTTEGGTLNDLKGNLTIQTNSLNLILGVVINSQADRLQTGMDHVSTMLGDIHEWFMDNLKGKPPGVAGATPTFGVANAPTFGLANAPTFGMASAATFGAASGPSGGVPDDNPGTPSAILHFELHEQSGQGTNQICPRAMLSQKVSGAYYSASLRNSQLFRCCCPSGQDAHRSAVDAFAARISGEERSWLLYKVANRVTDHLTSLVVKGVPPAVMYDFEELLVHGLSVLQTRQMLSRSIGTMLAHSSGLDSETPKANVLDLVSNATTLHRSITAVKFISGDVHYTRDNVDFVQMLHYKSIDLNRILDEAVLPQSAFEDSREAEIVVTYGKPEPKVPADGIARSILHLTLSSKVQYSEGAQTVFIKNIGCTAYDSDEIARPTAAVTVAFDFASAEAAKQFRQEVEAIRMDLYVIYLAHPRADENTLIKLQAQDVHTERMHICDADITILQSTKTQRFRLVVRSKSGYSVLSQELTEDFFQTLAVRNRPDYNTMSYEVYMDASGKRVVAQCSQGFTHLVFSDSKIEQVFSMGLAAVGGPSERYLTDASQPS